MSESNYDEYILYTTAVENHLLSKKLDPINSKEENRLVKIMLKSKRNYIECVRAIIRFRNIS